SGPDRQPGGRSFIMVPNAKRLTSRERKTSHMALLGTIVNTIAVVAGSLLGLLLPRMPDRMKTTITQGLGLAIIVLGMSMAFETDHVLIMIASLVLGGATGEWLKLDARLDALGRRLEQTVIRILGSRGSGKAGNIAQSFVTATLVYCVGAMAVLGAIDGEIGRASCRERVESEVVD